MVEVGCWRVMLQKSEWKIIRFFYNLSRLKSLFIDPHSNTTMMTSSTTALFAQKTNETKSWKLALNENWNSQNSLIGLSRFLRFSVEMNYVLNVSKIVVEKRNRLGGFCVWNSNFLHRCLLFGWSVHHSSELTLKLNGVGSILTVTLWFQFSGCCFFETFTMRCFDKQFEIKRQNATCQQKSTMFLDLMNFLK